MSLFNLKLRVGGKKILLLLISLHEQKGIVGVGGVCVYVCVWDREMFDI